MAKYRIVTPAGASFTTAGGGYALESEALAGMEAEIVEAPTATAGFLAPANGADPPRPRDRRPPVPPRDLRQRHRDLEGNLRRAGELPGNFSRLRRRLLR